MGNGRRRGTVLALALLVLGCAATAVLGWQSWLNQSQLAAARTALEAARVARGQVRLPVAGAKPLLTAQQRTAWNQIARQLNTPWSSLLDALETATPENIGLVSIEPDGAQGSVRVQVEAKTLDSLLAYAGALKSIELFENIVLIKHETNDQDSTRPLRLSLDIRLKAAAASHSATQEVAR
jgi:hypothetical protein